MLTDKCAKAFKDAGLMSPQEVLNRGVVIGPSTLLWNDSKSNLEYMGITEFARNLNAAPANNHGTNAVTIWDHPGKNPDTVDGRPRIFINGVAFPDDIGEAVRHEFIHAAGKEGREELFGHDLQYMGYTDIQRWGGGGKWPYTEHRKTGVTYDDIQAACR